MKDVKTMKVFCYGCRNWMTKTETGYTVHDGPTAVRRGDFYKCDMCGNEVISDFGLPFEYPLFKGDAEKLVEEVQR